MLTKFYKQEANFQNNSVEIIKEILHEQMQLSLGDGIYYRHELPFHQILKWIEGDWTIVAQTIPNQSTSDYFGLKDIAMDVAYELLCSNAHKIAWLINAYNHSSQILKGIWVSNNRVHSSMETKVDLSDLYAPFYDALNRNDKSSFVCIDGEDFHSGILIAACNPMRRTALTSATGICLLKVQTDRPNLEIVRDGTPEDYAAWIHAGLSSTEIAINSVIESLCTYNSSSTASYEFNSRTCINEPHVAKGSFVTGGVVSYVWKVGQLSYTQFLHLTGVL